MNQTSNEPIQKILQENRVIAVVGLSRTADRPSHGVARYLQEQGYRIIPVSPNLNGTLLGEQTYPDLLSIPEPVDVVEIFRRSEEVPPVVEQAIRIGAKAVWMQLGIMNEEAAKMARAAGLDVIMNHCMLVEHRKLSLSGALQSG